MGVPGQPSSPQPRPALTWDSAPIQEGMDSWRYLRRVELANFTMPLVIAFLREDTGALATDDAWREKDASREADRAIVDRAVGIAKLVQDTIDKARPRA